MALPSDYTIVGTVLALAVAILLLSGLALYVAFRVRETLREEKGGGARAAKVAFLIGLLFLSGGVFFFFASGFSAFGGGASSTLSTSSSSTSSTTGPSSASSASTTSSTATSTTTSSYTSSTSASSVSLQVSYPTSVGVGQSFYVQFSIYNSGATTLTGASLDVGSMSITFNIVNATVCNPQCTPTTWSGGVIQIGSLNPGSTVVTIGVKSPSSPTQYSGQASLYYQGETQPLSVAITIRVTGHP